MKLPIAIANLHDDVNSSFFNRKCLVLYWIWCFSYYEKLSFPIDIRLDWETYNIVPQDDQLLDMLVFIGQALPVIEDGQEVVPAVQEEDCYRCEEKPFIQVRLREHEGTRANRPFDVTPSQQVWLTVLHLRHGYTSQNSVHHVT